MKLCDFLLYKTKAEELCVICNPWRIATVWIDHEDLFIGCLSTELRHKEVIKDTWEPLETRDAAGNKAYVMAHYIYIKEG